MSTTRIRDGRRRELKKLCPSQLFGVSCAGIPRLPLLLALLAAAFAGCQPGGKEELLTKSDERYLPLVGKPSPPLKFKAIDGRDVDLEQLRGKVVLLDFWASWCPPCIEEIPNTRAAYERFNKDGFEIVGVSFDADRQRLEDVVKREKLKWPQYFDRGGRDAAPGKAFGILHWPSMWLLDRNGVIRYISAGAGLDRKITALLKENANPVTAARGVFENKAALDKSGDEPAKPAPAPAASGPISPPGAPQDAAYLHWLGKPFPPLKFTAIDGRQVDTDKLRGRVLLIDFWATWCPPCMAEIPNVKAVYERFSQQGFEIIGVSGDDSRAALERVVREKALKWPQHFEGRGGDAPNLRRYDVKHFPTMWLVDKQGIIRDVTGAVALNDKVSRLVRESASATAVKTAPAKAGTPVGSEPVPPANTSASAKAAPAPAATPAPRQPEIKLGDHSISVKNITITSKRSTALLQIGPSAYTVSPGMELVFPSGGTQLKARCTGIERSAVVLTIEGQTEPLRLVLP
ncbi:MAG: TlpA family protein disulfide reductase [Verrucomicrobia bacterium]|nr:TlpA family protein disulfide reductase [Verrucomicrobiota bacterium]